jgi:hypothetical protein
MNDESAIDGSEFETDLEAASVLGVSPLIGTRTARLTGSEPLELNNPHSARRHAP